MSILSVEHARALVDHVLEEGSRRKLRNLSVVVLDSAAAIRIALRDVEASLFGADIAKAKAHTALAFRAPTLTLQETFGANPVLVASVSGATNGSFMPLGGGVPLYADGVLVGAAAVAGSSPQNDHDIAASAARAAGFATTS